MKEKLFLEVKTDTDTFRLHGFLPALSEFGHIEPNRDLPRERTIFNAPKRPRVKSFVYDSVFPKDNGFNTKLIRDDRSHDKMMGLHVCREEDAKPVPSRYSSNYGRNLNKGCDPLDRSHVHIQYVETQFFRRNGVDFKGINEE